MIVFYNHKEKFLKTLAIATPTRNRVSALKQNLTGMIPELKQYDIPVYICDDSTNDDTEKMIYELSREYPKIFYTKNTPPKGHDKNCINTITKPSTDYVWYLGDSAIALPGTISLIFRYIQEKPDFVFLNRQIPRLHLGYTGKITDFQKFIVDNLWHITLTSATVYSRKALTLGLEDFDIATCRNFAQLGIIMNAVRKGCNNAIWIQQKTMIANKSGTKSYWASKTVPIFASDWATLVRSYSDILPQNKINSIIRSHSKNTGILGFFSLLNLRLHKVYTEEIREQTWDDLVIASTLPKWLLKALAAK